MPNKDRTGGMPGKGETMAQLPRRPQMGRGGFDPASLKGPKGPQGGAKGGPGAKRLEVPGKGRAR